MRGGGGGGGGLITHVTCKMEMCLFEPEVMSWGLPLITYAFFPYY